MMKIPYNAINQARSDYGTPMRKYGMELIVTDNRKTRQSEQDEQSGQGFLIEDGKSVFPRKELSKELSILSEIFDNPEKFTSDERKLALAFDNWHLSGKVVRNRMNCGDENGYYFQQNGHKESCSSCNKAILSTRNCSQSSCPRCSVTRTRKHKKKILPLLKFLPDDRDKEFFSFATITIPNTDTYIEGYEALRKYLPKVFRHPYLEENVSGTLQVIEGKVGDRYRITYDMKDGKWNVHAHAIFYGRYLSNIVKGYCKDCRQWQMQKHGKGFRCKCCKSRNIKLKDKGKSLLRQIFEKYFPCSVGIRIQRIGGAKHILNYMLKYLSKGKEDFAGEDTYDMEAEYVASTRYKRLFNATGIFINPKNKKEFSGFDSKKVPTICRECEEAITWEMVLNLKEFSADSEDSQDSDLGEAIIVTEESARDY